MAKSKKQDTIIGSGSTKTPILASENAPTAEQSQPSRTPTSIESGSTKPLSVAETLSLLQTLSFDARSLGCKTAILARGNRVYFGIETPSSIGNLTFDGGHIRINGVPVSVVSEKVTNE